MRHPREEWLALEATGDLGWWGAAQVRRHAAHCAACAASMGEYRALAGELAGLPAPELPPGLIAAALARVTANVSVWPAFRVRSLAAMAAVVAVAALLVFIGPQEPPPADVAMTASARAGAVAREMAGPGGRHSLVLYTGAEGRPVELSAGAGMALASHPDPRTGALLITGVGLEGLR